MQSVSKRKQTKKCSPSQNNTTYSFFSSLCPPELSVEHSKTRTENQLHPLEKERWDIRLNESPNHTLVGMTPHSQFSSFFSGIPSCGQPPLSGHYTLTLLKAKILVFWPYTPPRQSGSTRTLSALFQPWVSSPIKDHYWEFPGGQWLGIGMFTAMDRVPTLVR